MSRKVSGSFYSSILMKTNLRLQNYNKLLTNPLILSEGFHVVGLVPGLRCRKATEIEKIRTDLWFSENRHGTGVSSCNAHSGGNKKVGFLGFR